MEILHLALLILILPVLFSCVDAAPLLNRAGRRRMEPRSLETAYRGRWELFAKSSGVSTMHMQITPNNKAIMYDATQFQPTPMQLPVGNCRLDVVRGIARPDCWAHAVEFDFNTAQIRPLKISTNTWCSSGGLDIDGTIVSTGGYEDGWYSVRYHAQCQTCDFEEFPKALADTRWYATQATLADGSFIVVGGRHSFSYEFVPARGAANTVATFLPFLKETTDPSENNLYPIVHLSTDNNLFIFANNRSILLNPHTNTVLREFPPLPGGSRSYPATGMSALLPIDLRRHHSAAIIPAEVIICGGGRQTAYTLAWKYNTYLPALRNCGRMIITKQNPSWMTDVMPIPRMSSDMLILPNAELLIINGFSRGSAGWDTGRNPALAPFLYRPKARRGRRFRTLAPTTIPRMYHSSSAVLPDGSILVAGSNPHSAYNYSSLFPTEFRVEKFYPPYYDPAVVSLRPSIYTAPTEMGYGMRFAVEFGLAGVATPQVTVHMYAPPFTTHGISMNQRMLILGTGLVTGAGAGRWQVMATAPPYAAVAPPGYYMLFVVNRGVPSVGVWTRIR